MEGNKKITLILLLFFNGVLMAQQTMNWQLVWQDEFETEGLPDSQKWQYDTGDGCPQVCQWGNQEQQYYMSDRSKNARVENGRLIIEAHKEKINNYNYSSARLVTRSGASWKYGKIVVRARLPKGRGTWPAIWMLPESGLYGGWPESGEIDIMEHVGYIPDTVYGSVHTKTYHHSIGTQKTKSININDAESEFHDYSIIWDEHKIDFLLDEQPYFTFHNEKNTHREWPFDQKFYLILNLAVGGFWGGKFGIDEQIWPQKMEVEFVRVYEFQDSK
jgi:beta-glucanase (GH16 family)